LTPLLCAAAAGHKAAVKLLLSSKAKVNHETQAGRTALMGACQAGRTAIVRLLLENGAAVSHEGGQGETALIAAARHDQSATLELLLQEAKADLNYQAKRGAMSTALSEAQGRGRSEAVGLLLSYGAKMSQAGKARVAEAIHGEQKREAGVRLEGLEARPWFERPELMAVCYLCWKAWNKAWRLEREVIQSRFNANLTPINATLTPFPPRLTPFQP